MTNINYIIQNLFKYLKKNKKNKNSANIHQTQNEKFDLTGMYILITWSKPDVERFIFRGTVE